MANELNVAKVHAILTLHARGWSQRRIARELSVDRETVSRHLKLAGAIPPKPASAANAPPGSIDGLPAKPATPTNALTASGGPLVIGKLIAGGASVAGGAPPGSGAQREASSVDGCDSGDSGGPGPVSDCAPYRDRILTALDSGLSAVRIHQDLYEDFGEDAPSYHSVRRYVGKLKTASPVPYRRIEVPPGREAQVDFGQGAPVIDAHGKRRKAHVLRVVLGHSRAGYAEVVERQTTEHFIRCIENAFHHFGGVPQTVVLDNLRAAVSKADWFDPELNPKVQSFFAHYGTVALPTKPRTPRHKGKVERGIGYVQDNGLKGRSFTSIDDQNAHLRWWEANVADTRIHGTTQKQVRQLFEQVEKPAMQPLPATRFPCFEEVRRSVHRDGHVAVDKTYYSVPPEYLGRAVWVRYDSRLVRIFNGQMTLIATHPRKRPGQFNTLNPHILDQKIAGVERGATWLLQQIGNLGPHCRAWGEAVIEQRGIEGVRVLQGLLSLGNRHPTAPIERACELALQHGCLRLRTIRELTRRNLDQAHQQPALPSLTDEHPIIRPLHDYGRFVHEAFLQPHAETGS